VETEAQGLFLAGCVWVADFGMNHD